MLAKYYTYKAWSSSIIRMTMCSDSRVKSLHISSPSPYTLPFEYDCSRSISDPLPTRGWNIMFIQLRVGSFWRRLNWLRFKLTTIELNITNVSISYDCFSIPCLMDYRMELSPNFLFNWYREFLASVVAIFMLHTNSSYNFPKRSLYSLYILIIFLALFCSASKWTLCFATSLFTENILCIT